MNRLSDSSQREPLVRQTISAPLDSPLPGNSADLWIQRYQQIRQQSQAICEPLLLEDYHLQPTADVSPAKWHLAHTSWFFETFILQAFCSDYQVFHPRYSFLFNSYYTSVGERWQRTQRGDLSRPPVNEIYAYRAAVDSAMQDLLRQDESVSNPRLLDLLELGLNHEQQHQELLLTDLKYSLGLNPLFPVYKPAPETHTQPAASVADWRSLEAGIYEIGFSGPGFCFDNEQGRHKVYLHPYRIQTAPISNREWLAFINDCGYQTVSHWLADGWDDLQANGIQAPMHWHQVDNQWQHYTLHGLQALDLDAPVTHVSYYEADAYAQWAGYRLPTEIEWEVAAQSLEPECPETAQFVESGYYQPLPVQSMGFWGHVWEWTQSAYLPYPGFQKKPGAVGEYNGKFMCNQMVLRGGSCATPVSHLRLSYRNFFMPDKRWQFTGLRLAESL